MKKRILIPLLIIVMLLAFLAWRHFTQNGGGVAIDTSGDTVINTLPFGTYEGIFTPGEETGDEDVVPVVDSQGNPAEKLIHISRTPVAGAIAINQSGKTVIRYVDRATGHIYDVDADSLEKRKVTNRTIPKVYEAYFRKDGNSVLLRTLQNDTDTIENTVLTLTPPKGTSTDGLYNIAASSILRSDMGDVAVSSSTIYYTLTDSGTINSSDFSSNSLKTLFSSKFTSWRLAPQNNSLAIWSKSSSGNSSYAYSISNNILNKIVGPLNGLSLVSSLGSNWIAYSYSDTSYKFFATNKTNDLTTEIIPATIAEKCVWGQKETDSLYCGVPSNGLVGGEPSNWYQGKSHYADEIWKFDARYEVAEGLIEPSTQYNVNIDVYNPQISPDDKYLLFQNKTDLSLWALKLD